jgi:putative ABC transport system permease protein
MGRLRLIARLAVRDLRRRPLDAFMVVLVIGVAVTTLSIGLALGGVTDNPYRQTRQATAGPDVVASFLSVDGNRVDSDQPVDPATVDALVHAPGVVGHTGPFPLAYTMIQAHGRSLGVAAEGRDTAPAAIDQPLVTQGAWVRDGEVVIERGFADFLGVHPGDTVTLGGKPYRVAGTAVTAGLPSYPSNICHIACAAPFPSPPSGGAPDIGLVWLTTPAATALATDTGPLSYYLNLKLADPTTAPAFAAQRTGPGRDAGPMTYLIPWQGIRDADNGLVQTEQIAMQVFGLLLAMLAIAGLAVLAGRRMLDQTRRVGLLKAVGGTPGLVAAVLLAEHLALALVAAALGLGVGRLLTPALASAGAGLVGAPGAPTLTATTVALPVAVAVVVAIAATLVPALRAARVSTVRALADQARRPRRRAWLVTVSARLPVPLLLGLRLIARRPARSILSALSIAVAVSGIVAIMASSVDSLAGRPGPRADRLGQLTAIITVMLVVVAAVNALFVAWATVTDARQTTALARAFGATSWQVSAGMSAAQLLPALSGAVVGVPAGLYLYRAAAQQRMLTVPPAWQLAVVLVGTLLAVAALTAVPTRFAARRSVTQILQAERA